MAKADALEFTVLGMLNESPLHGYELRKRLTAVLGPFRALSYGSLYPCLRRLQTRGLLTEVADPTTTAKRSKIVYAITPAGAEKFAEWANQPGPDAWEDEGFAAHMAFFSATASRVRLRILEGRRARLEERVAQLQASLARSQERIDAYNLKLQQHGLAQTQSEVLWLDELITTERSTAHDTKEN